MTDQWAGAGGGIESSIEGAVAVTPDDATDLTYVTRALYLGVAGDVTVILLDGTQVQFLNLAAGVFHPLRVKRVLDAGTDADLGIVACY